MSKFVRKMAGRIGMPPGTLMIPEGKKQRIARITVLDYNADKFLEKEIGDIAELLPLKNADTVTWINIDGLYDLDAITAIGRSFSIHPLTLEDILHTEQRPKYEDFENYIFIVLKMLYVNAAGSSIESNQVSFILGDKFVITFEEETGDVFEPIRERLRAAKGKIRKAGADYLVYSLLDAIIDNYFVILEDIGEKVDVIEEKLVVRPDSKTLTELHNLKREMIFLRKSVWPLRELISGLEKMESELVAKTTQVYIRDLYDHTIQIIDSTESLRDMISGMIDIYLSSLSIKTNEIMKVLTIIATIFMPLTFIAGVYGMNFEYMPELKWKIGYFLSLTMMSGVAVTMILFFKRKGWM